MRTVDRRKNNGSKLVPENRGFSATSRTLLQNSAASSGNSEPSRPRASFVLGYSVDRQHVQ
jgi:hypothetical protein